MQQEHTSASVMRLGVNVISGRKNVKMAHSGLENRPKFKEKSESNGGTTTDYQHPEIPALHEVVWFIHNLLNQPSIDINDKKE